MLDELPAWLAELLVAPALVPPVTAPRHARDAVTTFVQNAALSITRDGNS